MKEIILSKGFTAKVDDSDYEYLNQWKWSVTVLKRISYARRTECVDGKRVSVFMHRLLMGATDSKIKIDHIDSNGLNNQRNNLREVTHSENLMNKRSCINSSSIYKGVQLNNAKYKYWFASIKVNGKKIGLGCHKNEKDAAMAYNNAAIKHFGSFAKLNSI